MVASNPKYRDHDYRYLQYRKNWKPDLAFRQEVRFPKSLAHAEMPKGWKALDLKLAFLLVSNLNTNFMWGEHRLHIRGAKKWLNATKSQILASMKKLSSDDITINTTAAGFFQGIGADPGTFPVLVEAGIVGQQLAWTFSGAMITALVDVSGGYGRLHVEAVRRLTTVASIRLYAVACVTIHSYTNCESLKWSPAELVKFLGGKPMKDNNNLKRFIGGVLADLKHIGVFYRYSRAQYSNLDTSRGKPISAIWFEWDTEYRANQWGAEIEADAKRAAADAKRAAEEQLELERNPPPLTEQQVYEKQRREQDARELKRAEWELKKELAVEQRAIREGEILIHKILYGEAA